MTSPMTEKLLQYANKRKVLVLNSHTLSDYQRCPYRFKMTHTKRLEPREHNPAWDKGTLISELLQHYYTFKYSSEFNQVEGPQVMKIANKIIMPSTLIPNEEKDFLILRFLQYHKYYKNESWTPIATEIGFSKILYSDSDYLFIYEGRPDLLTYIDRGFNQNRAVVDHKSQARKYNYYHFNNQAQGYLWAADCTIFTYNYFGLQETGKPDEWFRRESHSFQPTEIKKWLNTTIDWCFRIVNDLGFIQSWQCQSGWGVCEYAKICEAPDMMKADVASRFYQISTYRSW